MTIEELINKLQALKCPPNTSIMINDGWYGHGYPRDVTLGPAEHLITRAESHEASDCFKRAQEKVILIGFGS